MDDIKLTIRMVEPLLPEFNEYRFVVPFMNLAVLAGVATGYVVQNTKLRSFKYQIIANVPEEQREKIDTCIQVVVENGQVLEAKPVKKVSIGELIS